MNDLAELAQTVLADGQVASHETVFRLYRAIRSALRENEGAVEPGCAVRHFLVPGLYARECFLPAGSCVVGKMHTQACINVVLGDVTVVNPGEERKRYTGCETFTSPAKSMRACFAHADTWWTTFHPNPDNEADLDKLVARYSVDPEDDLRVAALLENH